MFFSTYSYEDVLITLKSTEIFCDFALIYYRLNPETLLLLTRSFSI